MKKICRICGCEFETKNGRQQDCNKPIKIKCGNCGKEFDARCSRNCKITCSKECQFKYAHTMSVNAYLSKQKKCEWCGELFNPKNNTQKYCSRTHYAKCVVCGNYYIIDLTKQDKRVTCSDECLKKLQSEKCAFRDEDVRKRAEETMLAKYGVRRPAQNSDVQAKMRATTKERYGVEHFTQNHDAYVAKAIETNRIKYGTDWAIQSQKCKQKQKDTSLARYGFDNIMHDPEVVKRISDSYFSKTGYKYPMCNPEVKEKAKAYNREHYGVEYYSQTAEYKDKYKQASLIRFGTEHPAQSEEVKARMRETCLSKYGADNYLSSEEGKKYVSERLRNIYGKVRYSQTADWKLNIMKKCTNIEAWMRFTEDPCSYIDSRYDDKPTYKKLADDLGVSVSSVSEFVIRKGLKDKVKLSMSYMEEEIYELLVNSGVDSNLIIKHDRQSIKPLELDISIPSMHLAFECNPTATHNSSFPYKGLDQIETTPKNYHRDKTNRCNDSDIFVFHIFGYEWQYKKPIIESMIRNIVSNNMYRIYARNCEIRNVEWEESVDFLNANHRQGSATSPVRLGLYYNDELVSLMTFSHTRNSIGRKDTDSNNCWELVRYCSQLNTSVVGGASKLFKYFITNYCPKEIRSYSDRARARGNLYEKLGFRLNSIIEPGYVWVDVATDQPVNRLNTQKHKLKTFLKDDNLDMNKSEKQIMEEHGYAQVFDSGNLLWIWTPN